MQTRNERLEALTKELHEAEHERKCAYMLDSIGSAFQRWDQRTRELKQEIAALQQEEQA